MLARVPKARLISSLLTGLLWAVGAEASTDDTPPLRLVRHPDGRVEGRQPVAPGDSISVSARAGRNPAASTIGGDDRSVIVRLAGEPLLRLQGAAAGTLRTTQAKRLAALDRLAGEIVRRDTEARRARGLAARTESEVVRRRYIRVFNGLAARVRREAVDELWAIPGVTGVWIDQRATASLADSVPLIHADQVWSQLGDRGEGVTVAIIDTGIDYTHPDLGGCFPDCKVMFGWDFVNNDADPMDDYGHGTHVAGIVAANGSVMGVAPDASLMAMKVLDQYGNGLFSDVIAGIELATDPDGDPGTNDGAQVMNISLGGPGDPDDPLSQAVDTAVAAGVVVAVAAGNSGPDFETVGSPGCARQALTVGASDKTDVIADFSSRGTVPTTYEIKPEVLAPGVGILSTVPTGMCTLCDPSGYLALDGTSMATPHVVGAAALLLSGNGGWTPQQVRAALMQRAVDLGLGAFVQGSGRIDAFAAATHQALVDLPDFSAGRDNPGLATFDASQTFTLANLTGDPIDYSLALAGNIPAGLTAALDRGVVHLGGNQSGSFTLSLTCDNALLPNVPGEPFAYEGTVVATGPSEVLHFPFALVKAPLLRVDYDLGPWTVTIHDKGAFYKYLVYPGTTLSTLVPATPVDVVNLYDDGVTWILREGLSSTTDTQVSIHKADASHTVAFHPTSESGAPVALTRSMTLSYLAPKAQNYYTYVLGDQGGDLGSPTTFHLSSMTAAYTFEASILQEPPGPGAIYVFLGGAADGVSGPIAFQNSPSDFRHVTWRYTPEPGGANVTPWTWLSTRPYATAALFGFAQCDPLQGLAAPFEREAYLIPAPYPGFGLGYLMQDVFGQAPIRPCEFSQHLYTTPYLMAASTSRIDAYHRYIDTPVVSSADPVFVSGVGPYSWTGRFANVPDQVFVDGGPYYHFMSQGKDVRGYPPLEYELSQGGTVVGTGTFNGSGSPSPLALPVTPGRFRLRVPYTSFHLGGQPARADVLAVFDTQSADPNPPYLRTLHLSSGGACVDRVLAGGAQVSLAALDDVGVSEVRLYSKTGGGFQPLAVVQQPTGEYSAAIPGTGAPVVVPLAAVLKDASGNSLTYIFCTAATASAEVCDGFDDDCDGTIPGAEADNDGDLVPKCAPDCDDTAFQVWDTPGEVAGVSLEGGGASTTLTWSPPAGGDPAAMVYDVLRSAGASDFVLAAVCLESGSGPDVSALDAESPAPGQVVYYLVRGRNACPAGVGTLGFDSNGAERPGRTCP